jgi:putative radical SAM enzyme (TIGR03279 family)
MTAARGKTVCAIEAGSPASKTKISVGDVILSINGREIRDVLDYMYSAYEPHLTIRLRGRDGKVKLVRLRKPTGAGIGLEFDDPLMDAERSCSNRCMFCFVDQLPRGMRGTLYYKDDDARLSFLHGNYVTLTNLPPGELERMISLRVSPINVSVHSTDPEIRGRMLGSGGEPRGILDKLEALTRGGITVNCQIVCCPGVNDGAELRRSLTELWGLYPGVASVSVVPVGLTRHRDGLTKLRAFDAASALETLELVEELGCFFLRERGSRFAFCADELYIKAGRELPDDGFYEDYPQLENGVGMMRLLITEFYEALNEGLFEPSGDSFSIATGRAAGRFIREMARAASERYGGVPGEVYEIRNDFFGESVDVAGLVTGGDIIAQLTGRPLGDRLLIPRAMLKRGEDVLLDGVTLSALSERLGVPVSAVGPGGADLFMAVLGLSSADEGVV